MSRKFVNRRGFGRVMLFLSPVVGLTTALSAQVNTTFIAGTGAWSVPANWSGGVVPNNEMPPGVEYNAFVDGGAGTVSTASISANQAFTVNNLSISGSDRVNIVGGGVSSALMLAGDAGGSIRNGVIDNAGTLTLQSGGFAAAELRVFSTASIQLVGGGRLAMTGTLAQIFGTGATPGRIRNTDNLVIGSGNIGLDSLRLFNDAAGTIRADAGILVIDPDPVASLINVGTIAANNGGTLRLSGAGGGTFDSIGGIINISTGGTLETANVAVLDAGSVLLGGRWMHSSGTATVGSVAGIGTITQSGGRVTLSHFRTNAVNVSGASRLTVAAGGGTLGTSKTSTASFSISGDAIVDLTDHALAIDYSGGTPINTIRQYLEAAYFPKIGTAWNGVGLTSSIAAGMTSTGLGYAEAADVFSSFPADFEGVTVDSTTLLVRYVRYGDADLDGIVDIGDFSRLALNFGAGPGSLPDALPPRDWVHGDFNYDRAVNIADLSLLASNFNQTVEGAQRSAASVPEASTAVIFMLGVTLRRSRCAIGRNQPRPA